jgi:hypothetical protein
MLNIIRTVNTHKQTVQAAQKAHHFVGIAYKGFNSTRYCTQYGIINWNAQIFIDIIAFNVCPLTGCYEATLRKIYQCLLNHQTVLSVSSKFIGMRWPR